MGNEKENTENRRISNPDEALPVGSDDSDEYQTPSEMPTEASACPIFNSEVEYRE